MPSPIVNTPVIRSPQIGFTTSALRTLTYLASGLSAVQGTSDTALAKTNASLKQPSQENPWISVTQRLDIKLGYVTPVKNNVDTFDPNPQCGTNFCTESIKQMGLQCETPEGKVVAPVDCRMPSGYECCPWDTRPDNIPDQGNDSLTQIFGILGGVFGGLSILTILWICKNRGTDERQGYLPARQTPQQPASEAEPNQV